MRRVRILGVVAALLLAMPARGEPFVYLAHRADLPPTSAAARVRDWLLSPAGQAVVAESGYVRLRS